VLVFSTILLAAYIWLQRRKAARQE